MAKKDPLLDDDDVGESNANERDAEKMRERVERDEGKERSESAEDDEGDYELQLDDDDEDDDDRPARREKRSNRYREAIERAERAERMAEETNRRLLELATRQAPQPPPQEVDIAEEIAKAHEPLYREHEQLYSDYQALAKSGRITPDDKRKYEQAVIRLNARKDLVTEQVKDRYRAQPQQQSAQQIQMQLLAEEYKDVVTNPRTFAAAQSYWHQRQFEGEQQSVQLMRESFDHARALASGRRPPSRPSQQVRSKFTGQGVGGGRGGNAEPAQTSIVMTPPLRRMARAAYPNLPEAEAYKKWARGPGKEFLKEQAKSRG